LRILFVILIKKNKKPNKKMSSNDNKNSYFMVSLKRNALCPIKTMPQFEDSMEPVLSKMNATYETYSVSKVKTERDEFIDEAIFLFKTNTRKRLGLLRNALSKNLNIIEFSNEIDDFKKATYLSGRCEALTKAEFNEALNRFKENNNFKIHQENKLNYKYSAKDIEILFDDKNWHKWQKKLYDLIFNAQGRIKPADNRKIIFIEDPKGNSGKSSFLKYLYYKYKNDIGLITEGTSSQLKRCITVQGGKKIYCVDLPRTADISSSGLSNALESLKNGLITSVMYGGGTEADQLLITPPWIIVTGNDLSGSTWTPDRWEVYRITENLDWQNISDKKRKEAIKEIELLRNEKKINMIKRERNVKLILKSKNLTKLLRAE
jgi:hypothetical protein